MLDKQHRPSNISLVHTVDPWRQPTWLHLGEVGYTFNHRLLMFCASVLLMLSFIQVSPKVQTNFSTVSFTLALPARSVLRPESSWRTTLTGTCRWKTWTSHIIRRFGDSADLNITRPDVHTPLLSTKRDIDFLCRKCKVCLWQFVCKNELSWIIWSTTKKLPKEKRRPPSCTKWAHQNYAKP